MVSYYTNDAEATAAVRFWKLCWEHPSCMIPYLVITQAAAKRVSTGSGAPQPKRPRGRGRPPPGKSKLSISGKPAQVSLQPPSVSAAAQSFAAAHSLGLQVRCKATAKPELKAQPESCCESTRCIAFNSCLLRLCMTVSFKILQNGQLSAQPQWGAVLAGGDPARLKPVLPPRQLPVEVPVEVVPSVQQAVDTVSAPSRRRRSALPRCCADAHADPELRAIQSQTVADPTV